MIKKKKTPNLSLFYQVKISTYSEEVLEKEKKIQ